MCVCIHTHVYIFLKNHFKIMLEFNENYVRKYHKLKGSNYFSMFYSCCLLERQRGKGDAERQGETDYWSSVYLLFILL